MKIYIAIWKDRHSDTTAHPFEDKDVAIEWARSKAKEYDRFDDYEEHDYGKDQGWVFYADYSCEGDCIYVVESELVQLTKDIANK
jgi:hypothetical protein